MREIRPFSIPHVCVIPVRMTEAWLMFDETAIRRASGNPNGNVPLDLPPLKNLESLADPKEVLHKALCKASQRHGRRLKKWRPDEAVAWITHHAGDFSPLRQLPAFAALEEDVKVFARSFTDQASRKN
jgi:hypothetical protein